MLGCSSPEEALSTPLAQLLDAFVILDEDGRPFDLRELPGRHALAGEESRPTLTQTVAQGDRRGALVGDQGDAGPRRARRGRARGQHHRGRHRRAPGRAPAALPVGGEHARLLVAGHRRHARQGRGRGGARAGRLVLRRRARRARRRAARGASAPATPTATALERVRDALSMDPDDPGSPAHVLRTGRGVLVGDFDDAAARAWAGGDEEQAAVLRASGTRSAMVVPMTAGDRTIGVVTLGHLAQRPAAGRGRARAGRRARAPRRHRGRERAPARGAHAHRHHAAAQPAAAAAADRAGRDHRRALSRRRGDERGRRRLLRRLRRRRRVDGRGRRRHRQGAGRRHHHLAGALHDAHGGDVRALAERRAGAPQRGAGRRPRPPPDLHRGVRAHRAGRGRDAARRPRARRPSAALPRLGRGRLRDRSARPGRCWAPSTAARGRRAICVVGAGDALVFYTDGVTDTRGEDGELFGEERLSELLARAAALDADEVASRIDDALQAFEYGQQRDDVALLVLRLRGCPRCARSAVFERQTVSPRP